MRQPFAEMLEEPVVATIAGQIQETDKAKQTRDSMLKTASLVPKLVYVAFRKLLEIADRFTLHIMFMS